MSYQVGSSCYGSPESAYSALAAQQSGALVQHGGIAYVLDATPLQDGIALAGVPADGSLGGFSSQVALTLQDCQLLTAEDGAAYGGLVLVVFATAFAFRAIAKTLWQSTGGGYDS